jgi:transposase
MQVATIGIDLAKHVFQVHGVDADGSVVVRRKLRRSEVIRFCVKLPAALIGMEACATARYWARELERLGHTVRLIPPSYVKPFVKRQKNDAADAEAICEAVSRPSMRFVPLKSAEQQRVLVLHRTRDLLIRQRTMLANALRAHLAEFGIIEKLGEAGLDALILRIEIDDVSGVPEIARDGLLLLAGQIRAARVRVTEIEKRMQTWHRAPPPRESTPGNDTGHRPNHRERDCRNCNRPRIVCVRTATFRVARSRAATAFQWRQRATARHCEAGRSLHSTAADNRVHVRSTVRARARPHGRMDFRATRQAPSTCRGRRARQ